MNLILLTLTLCSVVFSFYIYFGQNKMVKREAQLLFDEWKIGEEKLIREDAYQRSRAVSFGKTIEHYVPFMENFPVDPKDAKFFGKPIDYIAFVDAGSKKKCSVHFIEVKSGQSNLNSRQSNIKDAILEGRVHWHEFNVNGIWEHETKNQHLNS
jgi:predicted Holliday junction resolvase-like endonuclease